MFASTLFADENDVRDFEQQIQNLLRTGRADEAAAILETALGEFGKSDHAIAALCLACPVEAIEVLGWDALAARIAELDQADAPISAVGVDISWPGHIGLKPDADGCLEPYLETNYYNDSAYPFSTADRAAILQGYGPYGSEWQGGMADIDSLLSVRGLGRLYGAVCLLIDKVGAANDADPLDADAKRLGAAFVAVRLHQAIARAVEVSGLPRPLAVIVGSNESDPFFDAPVVSTPESLEFAPAAVEAEPVEAVTNGDEAGDVVFETPESSNVVQPEQDAISPEDEPSSEAEPAEDAEPEDNVVVQISGAALRQRFSQGVGDSPAAQPVSSSGGLLRRLFAR